MNWYNHVRLHSSLGYTNPVTYRNAALKKVV
ncbi:IS3 family transposase [Planococcus sp. ISL-110]